MKYFLGDTRKSCDQDNEEEVSQLVWSNGPERSEEFEETQAAFLNKDHKEVVDGLIDLIVIAIGTLELFNCDADKVWKEVHKSNMAKEPGANKSRKNPFGLPDMVKPEGWKGPEITKYDCGILSDIFEAERERLQMLREKRDLENEFKGQVANSQYE